MKKIILVLLLSVLGSSVSFEVIAADGSGTTTVSTLPTKLIVNTTGNELTFTFTAAEPMDSGAISITAPTGWAAPTSSAGTAGYTTASSVGILGKVVNSMDGIEGTTDWASTASTTLGLDGTVKKEGSYSLKAMVDVTAAAGEKWYYNYPTAQNWSSYTKVGFWINSSVATALGDLEFRIAEDASLSTPSATSPIPALTANTWTYVKVDLPADTTLKDSILSYGIYYARDIGAVSVYLDEALIGPDNVAALSFSGQTVTARILELAPNSTIAIVYGSGGGSSGITMPSASGNYTFDTKSKIAVDGILTPIASSPSVSVHPAAITNLTCLASGQGGAMFLYWTVPAGIIDSGAGYYVKYQQGNTITWDSATEFSQSWQRSAPGSSEQGLVTGLNPGTEYTLAMKVIGNANTLSDQSNPVTCSAPNVTPVSLDKIPPTSQITSPKSDTVSLVGESLKIEGTALDTGGSSVQKVEISFDGGKTWIKTKPIRIIDSNLFWEYLWERPKVGEYTVKSRATDWVGNVETPKPGIKVSIVTELPAEKPSVEKPITKMTVSELKTKIIETQQKIIQLLIQLIQLIQQKIQELRR